MTIEYAYLSGYLDGDGCFYLGKYFQKKTSISVFEYSIQVLSVEKANLHNFYKYGGTIRKKPKKERHKQPFIWVLKSCESFAISVQPFLIDKNIQCNLLLQLIASVRKSNFQPYGRQTYNHRLNLINQCRENKMKDLVTKELIDKLKVRKSSISPTSENFAYLAGLIESEGCLRIKSWKPLNKPNKVHNISLEIGNTRYPIFPWLIDRFGGNISFSHTKRNKRAVAIWSLQSASLNYILLEIHSFLRTRKKEVCELLIEFQKTVLPNGGDRHSQAFKEKMACIISKREKIITKIHKLNKKGD